MFCEGNRMSDVRIGEALIKEVIQEELKDFPSEEIPPLTQLAIDGKTVQEEQKLVYQLALLTRKIGDGLNAEYQDLIDGVARCPGSKWERFKEVADVVFKDGINWGRIVMLFYVAGKLAVKMVEVHLPQSVRDVLKWTLDFFKNNLLGWIVEHGGWISSFSELAVASVQSVSSVNSITCGLVLFAAGLAIGSVITWKLTRQL
ncbi:apoptosis regulator BAX [Labrus bergylta]|uniref:Apoptosis regulator BAX-like n=1 Tax=Labrus bergylta TaxID=56723 RepID=A0A3Q3ER51_9LABR|nr:apoptosis regulator BAX-like [Labrus bergylta]